MADMELDDVMAGEEFDLSSFATDLPDENVELAEDLTGFASCFPEWTLLPPEK